MWTRSPTDLADAMIATMYQRILAAAQGAASEVAAAMQEAARANASWTDQTGAARAGLFGRAELANDILTITLSHGPDVDYGIYLETRWAERYAIIWPTIRDHMDTIYPLIAARMK
jgi:hypothetical protein